MFALLRVASDRQTHAVSKALSEVRAELAKSLEGADVLAFPSAKLDDEIADAIELLVRHGFLVSPDRGYFVISADGLALLSAADVQQIFAKLPPTPPEWPTEVRSIAEKSAFVAPSLPSVNSNYTALDVFFATDRAQSPTDASVFSDERSMAATVTLGKAVVSIPRDHRLGHLESPSIWRLEFRPDPEKHVVVQSTATLGDAAFYQGVADAGTKANAGALVFIHGYNVAFRDALRRTGQLAYDLGHHGPAIAYSWPSKGQLFSYPADEATIEWTAPHLAAFLTDLAEKAKLSSINIVAHSMGNRALLNALVLLSAQHSIKFGETVFTAPDVDRAVFLQKVSNLSGKWQRATLYANSKDEALAVSRGVHQSPRAGDTLPEVLVCAGIDSIDVSNVVTDFVGHGYFGDNNNVIADLFYVFRGAAMPRFRLTQKQSSAGWYWLFTP